VAAGYWKRFMITQSGSLRLFRIAGIQVFLHWSWFLVAVIEINNRRGSYSSVVWNAAEYVALFVIVLMHEFGHALACRQVGGQANRIVLWPLGGVAFVAPPQRPGATLWAIAAGPLVNLVLIPVALMVAVASERMGWGDSFPDAQHFLWMMVYINVALLIFNLLPVYPLDGGQILRSLLWFWLGRTRSLKVATIIGFAGAAGLLVTAFYISSIWIGALALFMGITCWRGWKQAGVLSRMDAMPRHSGFACPSCKAAPPVGAFWICNHCRTLFDTFATGANCPKCQARFETTICVQCGASRPMSEWVQPHAASPG
jgi:Zn-dependent protease